MSRQWRVGRQGRKRGLRSVGILRGVGSLSLFCSLYFLIRGDGYWFLLSFGDLARSRLVPISPGKG